MASASSTTLTVGGTGGKPTTFTLTNDSLVVRGGDKKWPGLETTVRHVLWAELSGDTLQISFLARRKKRSPLSLVHITGKVNEQEEELATSFTTNLMDAAYTGVKRRRRLKVLVNPKSGPGNSVSHYMKKVEPVFRAARCDIDLTLTTHSQHATQLMKELPLDKFDAIVTVSGDGLVHEVVNGFAAHEEPAKAFRTPIMPVPSGSGNGLAVNLLGVQDGYDVSAAALNAIKGRPMSVDICSVSQKDTRVLSFMSQCVGLFADVDIGTEHLRFMGPSRFVLGYIYGIMKMKACPVKLSLKNPESDKRKMVETLKAYHSKAKTQQQQITHKASNLTDNDSTMVSPLPELKHSAADGEGWITFDKPILYIYAGKGPYVSRDFMQFPVSMPDDGLIDVVVHEVSTRREMLGAMDGSDRGQQYWMKTQHYFKAQAYRIEPYSPKGCLAVDGEEYPFETFQVEVHQGLATLLSPCGYYKAEFGLPDNA
ncbi:hypothetical protein AcW1_005729 [Taiwanofungus camphoratus]|nr:hypothetical protein AcW2_004492 [Antrodia cinnamomea]KAI0934092.1 hypothetical protein AcV5_006056 [Antrodia cinnamomea]KAI0950603.1 hypothetical protein AcV7_009016 [Antrodia cinnamomea]KAI0957286.1 hypothetical protein AcW1_005729 [Antrodia cinnamomea]